MKKAVRYGVVLFLFFCLVTACSDRGANAVVLDDENKEAKAMLQGIWKNGETEDVAFKAEGDTLFYPDTLTTPVHFLIANDTFVVGNHSDTRYAIVKQTLNLFVFKNPSGELSRFVKSIEDGDSVYFSSHKTLEATQTSEVMKHDTVVTFCGQRYHCYVTINPTKFKVTRSTYNSDGMATDRVFYDNIIHLSVYQGDRKLFSSNISKQLFVNHVPHAFLSQAVLGNIKLSSVDSEGFHFDTTICIPEGASCYLLDINISLEGRMQIALKEY